MAPALAILLYAALVLWVKTDEPERCQAELYHYFNVTTQSCQPCAKCPRAYGRNHQSEIQFSAKGQPLDCYMCERCPDGKHVDNDEVCVECRDCGAVKRSVRVPCQPDTNAICGDCLQGFYDYYQQLSGMNDTRKPCRSCKFASLVNGPKECQSHKHDNERHSNITVIVVMVVIAVMGVVAVTIIVVRRKCCRGREGVRTQATATAAEERYSENTGSAGISTPSTDDRLLSATDDTCDDIQPLLSNVHGCENTVPDSGSSRNTPLHQPPSTSGGEMANQCSRMPSVNTRVNRESVVRSGEPSIGEGETESFGAELPKAPRSNDKEDLLVSINTSATTNVPDGGNLILLEDLMPDLYNDDPPQTATVFPREDEIAAASPTPRELPNTCCRPALKRSASCPVDTSTVAVHQQEWGAAEAVILAGQKQLKVVSECLGVSYIARLLRELKLPEADAKLDNLKHQNMDGEELVYQSLLSWKRWAGDMATVTRLVSALEAIHRRDVSGKL